VTTQDLAETAIAGGKLPEEQSPEDMAGDYSWDCEYNFDLLVRLDWVFFAVQFPPCSTVLTSVERASVGLCFYVFTSVLHALA
jgi:hypothetical protein